MTATRLRRAPLRMLPALGFALFGLSAPLSASHAQQPTSNLSRIIAPTAPRNDSRCDPQATLLLKKMSEAYAHLDAFDLRIHVFGALIPLKEGVNQATISPTAFQIDETKLSAQGGLHVAFRGSNRLLIEMEQFDALTNRNFDLRWVSDGQNFWSYTGQKNIYTREKAPGSIHDFMRLKYLNGGTLELMMLIGINPFADLSDSVEGVHRLPDAAVRGVPMNVVSLEMEDPIEVSELRFYIGKEDNLLHRMEIASTPVIPHEGPLKVGSKLDGLLEANQARPLQQDVSSDPNAPDAQAAETPKPRKRSGSFVRFEDDLDLRPDFPSGTFTFVPPKNSLQMGGDPAPVKHLTMRQRLQQMAKNARKQREEMLRNGQKNDE